MVVVAWIEVAEILEMFKVPLKLESGVDKIILAAAPLNFKVDDWLLKLKPLFNVAALHARSAKLLILPFKNRTDSTPLVLFIIFTNHGIA